MPANHKIGLTAGSLFSGIGGIDLGFRQSGFYISWAIENDPSACKTYRYNFCTTDLLEADIRAVDPASLSSIDVLTAGFPCQPYPE